MSRVSLVAVFAAFLAACSEPTSTTPTQLNLDRPVDIGFACWGDMQVNAGAGNDEHPDGSTVVTAQPSISCTERSNNPSPNPDTQVIPGQSNDNNTFWFGFILQSAPGTVAIVQFPVMPATSFQGGSVPPVRDADLLTPGKNSISVGEEPIAIATDHTGCYEVTANAGSCDMSALEINGAVDNDPKTPVRVDRIQVTNASGAALLARPAAMLAPPSTTAIGNLCPAEPSGLVYIAYPSCHLVAAVEMTTVAGKPVARMVAGLKYDDTGLRVTDGNETCPAECADGGQIGVITEISLPRPQTLSLDVARDSMTHDPVAMRLAIGADKSASFDVIDLDPATALPKADPAALLRIPLENRAGDLGITAIALSPEISMGGDEPGRDNHDNDPTAPGGQAQYIYGVATDGTVRVADVLNQRRECETQIDGRFLQAAATPSNVAALQCPRIGDPALPRRAGARGPGIELIGDVVPLSVAFFTVPRTVAIPDDRSRDELPSRLIGHFAVITGSNGSSYVANVDDDNARDSFSANDPFGRAPALVLPHQLRDAATNRGASSTPVASTNPLGSDPPACGDFGPSLESLIGGPRTTTAPARNLDSGPVASNKADELPSLRSVTCDEPPGTDGVVPNPPQVPVSEVQLSADLDTRNEVYPDLHGLRIDEQWFLTWEGSLLPASFGVLVDNKIVARIGRTRTDATGLHLIDPANPFCEVGVEPFDIAQLLGCNPTRGNADCPSGYECFLHPESQLGMGACLLSNEADRLANLCRDFLISGRRYTVNSDPHSGDLVLLPRKHVLRTTPVDGCVDDNQCALLANVAARARTDQDPIVNPIVQPTPDPDGKLRDVDGNMWSCRTDEARAPVNAVNNRRCVQVCTTNDDCNVADDELNRRFSVSQFNMICQSGVCMESIAPPQQCLNGPQRYDLHASDAFAVLGSRSGFVHPVVADASGKCVQDPNASVLDRGRIPLTAPPCDPLANPITGALDSGGVEANPCSLTATQSETARTTRVQNNACVVETGGVVPREAPAIRFRNHGMKLTLVDPYYPGDSACILDRAGQLGNIPLVYQGYQLAFHQIMGFAPYTLPVISPVFPVKVVAGPTESIWILDDGDFLSTTIGVPSTRGRVFRVESVNVAVFSLLQ